MRTDGQASAWASPWLAVWSRAIVGPAWRRAGAVWVGATLVAAVTFGPTGLHPRDVTTLALREPGAAIVLAVTWLLVFVPTARLLVRSTAASYLRSLPGPWLAPKLVGGAALLGLQLPWLALWVAGDGVRGLAIVVALTIVIAVVAAWQPRRRRAHRWPRWTSEHAALRAVYLRALRRRATDALVRGAGLAVFAGLTGGLFVRNNQLTGESAAVLGGSVIAIVLVVAQVGALLVLLEAHRQSAWLAASLGISRGTRVLALVEAIAVVHLAATTIAVAASVVLVGFNPWLVLVGAVAALGTALGEARVLLGAEDSPTIAARAVVGSVIWASLVIMCLGLFGATAGLLALAALGLAAILTVRG